MHRIAETNIITAPLPAYGSNSSRELLTTPHVIIYRSEILHGSLVAFSIRVYVCERSTNVVRNLEEKWNGNGKFHRYVIYEKSRSRIFEMDDRGLREIRALCEVNNGASGTSNANDPLKTEIPKRVAIATESIPPSMID